MSTVKEYPKDGAADKLLSISYPNGDSKKGNVLSFSEALSLTKFGKFNYTLIFLSGMIMNNLMLETTGMCFVLPIAQCDLQLTNQDKGILSAIGYIGIIVSSHLWGYLADTEGRRRVIRPTLIAGFVVTLFSCFAHTFWLMVVLRFLNGFLVSGSSATIYAYLGEFHTDKTRSRAMMGSSFVYAIGTMALPLFAFLIINQEWVLPMPFLGIEFKPWRLFLLVCGISGLLCGLSLYFLPESPKFLMSIGREAEAIEVLQQMAKWNGVKTPLNIVHIEPEATDESMTHSTTKVPTNNSGFILTFLNNMWKQTLPLFNKKYLRITLLVCFLQFWLFVVNSGMFMWFPHIINSMAEFMHKHPGKEKQICQIVYDKDESLYKEDNSMECIAKLEDDTFYYSLIMEILYAANFAVIGFFINRLGKIPLLFIQIIFCTLCGFGAMFVSNLAISAYLYVLLFLVGAATNILAAATVELYPTSLRAMSVCISLMVGRMGSVAGANIVGALLGTHCELTFYISCGALLVCAFLALLLPRKSIDTVQEKVTDVET